MYRRSITTRILEGLFDTPVVYLAGARQAGKTTLVRSLIGANYPATYLTLDDSTTLAAASYDPAGFVRGLTGPTIIDEIQNEPALFRSIKAQIDENRRPGGFLLTGSVSVMALPQLSEALVGRMDVVTLWPLAQTEIENHAVSVVDDLFGSSYEMRPMPPVSRGDLVRRIVLGGFPEPLARMSEGRRKAWFGSYVGTILQRDVRSISNIESLHSLPRLLSLLASRVANLLNLSDISIAAAIPKTTLYRYMAVLEAAFMIHIVQPWSNNLGSRFVKTPKLLFCDTGLGASLLGIDAERLSDVGPLYGQMLENFVAMELCKHISWSVAAPSMFHYRTHSGHEVDIVLEDASGRVVGVEVKASATLGPSDFRGLRSLADAAGDRFTRGIVLYSGEQMLPFGKDLYAVPISVLWS